MFVLWSSLNQTLIKHKGPIKLSNWITPTYLNQPTTSSQTKNFMKPHTHSSIHLIFHIDWIVKTELSHCPTTKMSQNMVMFPSMSHGWHKSMQQFLHSRITYAPMWFHAIHHIHNKMVAQYGSFNITLNKSNNLHACMHHMAKLINI